LGGGQVKDSEHMQIAEKIRLLDQQVVDSRTQRTELNKEARKLAETRDEFNEKFKKLRDEIQVLKNKRDELNAQVRGLKAKRDEAREVVSKNRAQIKALTEKLEALDSMAPGSYESTRREMEKLEWRIQTNPLSQREENKLISQVKDLEGQLNILKKKKEIEKKIGKIRDESKSIELQANIIHKRLTELAEESELYHKKMMEFVSSATELKRKADETHQAYIDTRTKGDNAHFEYLAKISMIKELENQIRSYYEAEQAQKEVEVQKKVEELATNKLKKGKKLTFEEFKLLVDKGAI
jgi:uncharacterized coiled-coil DUF342 family protein